MRNVLLVEDDPLVSLLIREELQAAGYAVTFAGTAPEALRAIEEPRSFEALVTDIDLGGPTDGFGVAAAFAPSIRTSRWYSSPARPGCATAPRR